MDSGKPRNLGDKLSLQGVPNGRTVAAITRAYIFRSKGNWTLQNGPKTMISDRTGLAFVADRTETMVAYSKYAATVSRCRRVPGARLAALYMLACERADADLADSFFSALASASYHRGVYQDQGLDITPHVRAARDVLDRSMDKLRPRDETPPWDDQTEALVIRAWNRLVTTHAEKDFNMTPFLRLRWVERQNAWNFPKMLL